MSMCGTDRHIWNWSAGTTTDVLPSPALRCACGALAHGDINPLNRLTVEIARLAEQLRIATETLGYLSRAAGHGKSARHMSTMAEDALIQMSVVQ